MRTTSLIALGAIILGTALTGAAPAKAAVGVSVGVGTPAVDECVAYRTGRHRHVVKYEYCDAPVYSGDPVVIEGVTYRDNLHYRMHRGHREFWIRNRWVRHD